jgi:hypothetical protein
LRDPDDIASGQHLWNGRELDGRRLGVTSFLDGFENWRGELQGAKWHNNKHCRPLSSTLHLLIWFEQNRFPDFRAFGHANP